MRTNSPTIAGFSGNSRAALLALLAASLLQAQIAIREVTVIEVASGRALPNRTVVIEGNRIVSVEAGGSIPAGAQVIEGGGKFLIPGLWDMHVHMRGSRSGSHPDLAKENEAALPLYLANGVTGVREMGGDLVDDVLRWRSQDVRAVPRIATCGPKLDGPNPEWPGSIPITSPEDARAAVRRVKAMGADFVKIYNNEPNIPRDAYLAILDEAKRQQLRATGHAPLHMTIAELSNFGQDIEHTNEYLAGCVRHEKQLKADLLASRISGAEYEQAVINGFDRDTAVKLFRVFAAKGTYVTPTLGIARPSPRGHDVREQYLMTRWLETWDDRGTSPSAKQFRQSQQTVRMMRDAGVQLLAGSDTGASNEFTFPGFSLQDELGYLVDAGLTPLEALQSATTNAARWLGKQDSLGDIAPGKLADVVLLDANPLKNIRNTRKIHTVIKNGHIFKK